MRSAKQEPTIRPEELIPRLEDLARNHPSEESRAASTRAEILRTAFHVSLVAERAGEHATIADVGGGIGLFSLGCAAVGMKVILVDDFGDPVNIRAGHSVLDYHRSFGIEVVTRDVIDAGLGLPADSLDAVTTFDSMEHWHHSPKQLFAEIARVIHPGGLFVLGVPNCVNLRKRLTVPLGRGKWSAMSDWYDQERFRGHVREPDVADLRYIARDMGLEKIEVLGRNWLGYKNERPLVRGMTRVVDLALRPFPTLCSDLYLIGRTPATGMRPPSAAPA